MTANNIAAQGVGLGLLGLLDKPEVRGAWYNKREVKLDGYKFVSCRFDGCHLVVTSTHFELEDCYIDDKTTIVYGGGLIKAIQLYNLRNAWATVTLPAFAPKRNPDGTISVKG